MTFAGAWVVLLLGAAPSFESPEPRERVLAARAPDATLEALAARLSGEPDPDVRRALQDAMARRAVTEAQLVATLVGSPEPAARAFAAWALGRSRTDATLAALLAARRDPEPAVREAAYRALGEAGDRVAIDTLVNAAVHDDDPACRDAARAAAERLAAAPTVSPDLAADLVLARGEPGDARLGALRRLGQSGDRRAVDPLLAVVRAAPDAATRRVAIAALGRLGDARAVPVLLEVLADAEGRTRSEVLGALSHLRDESTADAVAPFLKDADPQTRQLAVRALGRIAPPDLFARLTLALRDPMEEVRMELLRVTSASHDRARLPVLSALLADPSPFVRAEAVRAWADAGSSEGIVGLLEDTDALVRLAAADALGGLRLPGSAESVRAAAARARAPAERAHLIRVADALDGLPVEGPAR